MLQCKKKTEYLYQFEIFNRFKLLHRHLAIYIGQMLLKDLIITSFKQISSLSKIAYNLLFFIIYLPILMTSSMPLYWGEYLGVHAYRNPSSSILDFICLLLWSPRLSIIRIMSSNGYLALKFSRNILNFFLVIDYGWISIWSRPYSRDTAKSIAFAFIYISYWSRHTLVFGKVHTWVGIVLLVTMHSSR